MNPILELRDVSASYGAIEVLRGISLRVEHGGITALLGANGAGKTTTLRAIFGMVERRGEILADGRRIDGLATENVVRCGFAHVPENRGTFNQLSVLENLRLGAYLRAGREEVAADIERMFERFPVLGMRRDQQAGTLSGGEQQMLALARALMMRPRLLLLDEPSFGLAPLIVREIFEAMARIRDESGISILLIEQNANLALAFADSAYLLQTGQVVLSGSSREMCDNPEIRRSYLGVE